MFGRRLETFKNVRTVGLSIVDIVWRTSLSCLKNYFAHLYICIENLSDNRTMVHTTQDSLNPQNQLFDIFIHCSISDHQILCNTISDVYNPSPYFVIQSRQSVLRCCRPVKIPAREQRRLDRGTCWTGHFISRKAEGESPSGCTCKIECTGSIYSNRSTYQKIRVVIGNDRLHLRPQPKSELSAALCFDGFHHSFNNRFRVHARLLLLP